MGERGGERERCSTILLSRVCVCVYRSYRGSIEKHSSQLRIFDVFRGFMSKVTEYMCIDCHCVFTRWLSFGSSSHSSC